MTTTPPARWKRLIHAIEENSVSGALGLLSSASADDKRRFVSMLTVEQRDRLCQMLPMEDAANLLETLPESQAVNVLEELPTEIAADVIEELPSTMGGDLLRELDEKNSEAILSEIDDIDESNQLRELASYAADSAGGLMSSHFIAFDVRTTVAEVLAELGENTQKYTDAEVQYFYVTDSLQQLVGVLALRNLVLARRGLTMGEVMISTPLSVGTSTGLEELQDVFEGKNYLALPVVDDSGCIKGVVTRASVEEALSEMQTESYLKASGIVGGEELRSMPMKDRCIKRLAWLGPNIFLNLLAASIIASYEDTLQSVIALAVFLPMVSDMSGCSGNQAVAVSIRELTLGIIRPGDYLRVLFKESLLGMNNGMILGMILGTLAAVWKDNVYLGLVIGGALTLNTILSVVIGGLIPLVLKRFKADPALASGPILTTCTDMSGFFLVLSLASIALSQLA